MMEPAMTLSLQPAPTSQPSADEPAEYTVAGLPSGVGARIARHGEHWALAIDEDAKRGDWTGAYATADDALHGLCAHIEGGGGSTGRARAFRAGDTKIPSPGPDERRVYVVSGPAGFWLIRFDGAQLTGSRDKLAIMEQAAMIAAVQNATVRVQSNDYRRFLPYDEAVKDATPAGS
jgi:hypothetical protein